MNNPSTVICFMCGSNSKDASIVHGANGSICAPCFGEIFLAVAKSYGQPRGIESVKHPPSANKRCTFCDQNIPKGTLVAYRNPLYFCDTCLNQVFGLILSGPEPLALVPF